MVDHGAPREAAETGDASRRASRTPLRAQSYGASALRWLRRHQSPDGRWSATGWQDRSHECCSGRGWLVGLGLRERDAVAAGWLALAFESARSAALEPPRGLGLALALRGAGAPFRRAETKRASWSLASMRALARSNRRGGCEDGSWDPVDGRRLAGGRVYATAINALSLEIYDRNQAAASLSDQRRRSP